MLDINRKRKFVQQDRMVHMHIGSIYLYLWKFRVICLLLAWAKGTKIVFWSNIWSIFEITNKLKVVDFKFYISKSIYVTNAFIKYYKIIDYKLNFFLKTFDEKKKH